MNYGVQQPTESPLVGLDDMAQGDRVVFHYDNECRHEPPRSGVVAVTPWVCQSVPTKGRIAQPCVKIEVDGVGYPKTYHLRKFTTFANVTRNG